ncbi:beta-microseminoprotein-like [Halichoeres trimaculatus]|uniref:beta-microseminoprotein-like n=1 Tax=Halichoeres trimaculatus TaxID=147232 RepID=UPI003D9F54A9
MKYLALSLVLCALYSMSHGQCFFKQVPPDATFCKDDVDDTWHPVGSNWRNSQCMDCSCGGCCAAYSTPRSFPEDCVSVFDQQACEYIVHKRNNPSIRCEIYAAVGK